MPPFNTVQSTMAKSQGKIVEGVFAINKPPCISSAQVIRNLQHVFNPSSLFAPWIEAERAARKAEEARQRGRNRRKDKRIQVKIGHGGTLDPLATGVLIMGIGSGTKQLGSFLECTKTYEATVLFGAATDTYDVLGKVLRRAPHEHVTRRRVEEALEKFRGKIMQRPPIYSALRVQGKRLYEYAREGTQVPTEIQERPVEVKKLGIIEWLTGGSHKYKLPEEEAEDEAKNVAEKVLHLDATVKSSADVNKSTETTKDNSSSPKKRKRPVQDDSGDEDAVLNKRPVLQLEGKDPQFLMSGGLQTPDSNTAKSPEPQSPVPTHDHRDSPPDSGPPAVKLRMTVTSGFYVRSLSHDLGEVVGSLGCMSELVRIKQGDFELGRNVLEYEELAKDEEIWAPKVEGLLDEWEDNEVTGSRDAGRDTRNTSSPEG